MWKGFLENISARQFSAASIFIAQALGGEAITPCDNSMFRPMLYVDVRNVCRAFESYALKILDGNMRKGNDSLGQIFNLYYPQPITILELAEIVKSSVIICSNGKIRPQLKILRSGQPNLFSRKDKDAMTVDIAKVRKVLGTDRLINPVESIELIVRRRMAKPYAR